MFERDFERLWVLEQKIQGTPCKEFEFSRAEYIGSGTYNDVFFLPMDGYNTVMRLSYYNMDTLNNLQRIIRDYKDKYGAIERDSDAYKRMLAKGHGVPSGDPVRIKNNFSRFTNVLCSRGICPHFVYSYGNKDCKNVAKNPYIQARLDKGQNPRNRRSLSNRYNNLSFQEAFDMDLQKALYMQHKRGADGTWKSTDRFGGDSIVESDEELKGILFQIIYGLAVLQHYLPGFRHNDLSLANVLLSTSVTPKSYSYSLYGRTYQLRNAKHFVAIHDFDLAHADAYIMHLDGEGADFWLKNKMIQEAALNASKIPSVALIRAEHNPTFDTNFFLKYIMSALERIRGRAGVPFPFRKTLQWLDGLGLDYDYYTAKVNPRLIPSNLLLDPFFADLLVPPREQTNFGVRPISMEVHVPDLDVAARMTYVDSNKTPAIVCNDRGEEVLKREKGQVTASKCMRYMPAIFRYDGRATMNAFDAALVMDACQSRNPKILKSIAQRLGVTPSNNVEELCTSLNEIVHSIPGVNDLDYRMKHCSAFFTVDNLLGLAVDVYGLPAEELYTMFNVLGTRFPKSKRALCDILKKARPV